MGFAADQRDTVVGVHGSDPETGLTRLGHPRDAGSHRLRRRPHGRVAGPADATISLTRALLLRHEGCTLVQALASVRPSAAIRRERNRFLRVSSIVRRDSAGYVLWRTPSGDYWAPDRDLSLFFILAELELEPYGAGRSGAARGDVVVDCGAHLGVFTRQALRAGATLVVAIEPGPQAIECLKRTFAPEIAAGSAIVEPQGVWDRKAHLRLYSNGDTAVSTVFGPDSAPSVGIPLTTIDLLVPARGLSKVDFIKMDIEGSERQALAGARRTLMQFKPRPAIASYHRIDDHLRIPEIVLQANPAYRSAQVGCRLDLGAVVPLTLMFR